MENWKVKTKRKHLLSILLFLGLLILVGCNKQENIRPTDSKENLQLVQNFLSAMIDSDVDSIKSIYKEGSHFTPQELVEKVDEWGLEGKSIEDFTFKKASYYVYHVSFEEESYIAIKLKENPAGGYLIDFVELIK